MDIKQFPSGVLRLGTTKTWARYLMPSYILAFQHQSPEIQIHLSDGTSEDMAFSVLHGQNDVAIIARMPLDPRLDCFPFPGHERDQLVLVVPPKHRLSHRKKIYLRELVDEQLILRGRGSGIREAILHAATEQGLHMNVVLEAGSAEFIKAMVVQGAGVSVLTTLSVQEEEMAGRVKSIPLADPGLWLNIDVVSRKDGYRSNAVSSFLTFLAEWRYASDSPRRSPPAASTARASRRHHSQRSRPKGLRNRSRRHHPAEFNRAFPGRFPLRIPSSPKVVAGEQAVELLPIDHVPLCGSAQQRVCEIAAGSVSSAQ